MSSAGTSPGSLWMLVSVLFVLSLGSCDHGYDSPDPLTLDYHVHLLVVHHQTVNHAANTTDLVSATSDLQSLRAVRASGGLARDFVGLGGSTATIQLVWPDTARRTCTMSIRHFVGYQRRYGGDTMRYGQMDADGLWHVDLVPYGVKAANVMGETLTVKVRVPPAIPDSVREGGVLELDVTYDLAGLFCRDSGSVYYQMEPQYIVIRQR